MNFLNELLANNIVMAALLSWLIAQVIKVILVLVTTKKVDLSRMFGSGGMPSSHSSLVCSLVVMTGRIEGASSVAFAITFALAVIVMYDAANVRQEAGKHAKMINIIMDQIEEKEHIEIDKNLKELLGHTPFEVIIGAILGCVVGGCFPIG